MHQVPPPWIMFVLVVSLSLICPCSISFFIIILIVSIATLILVVSFVTRVYWNTMQDINTYINTPFKNIINHGLTLAVASNIRDGVYLSLTHNTFILENVLLEAYENSHVDVKKPTKYPQWL